MRARMKNMWRIYKKTIVVLLMAVLVAGVLEFLFNWNVIVENRKGGDIIHYDAVELKSKNFKVHENSLVSTGKEGKITINLQGQYIDKLVYSFRNLKEDAMLNATIDVNTYDAYGNDTKIAIVDNNPYVINESTVVIRKKVQEISIHIPKGHEGLEISNIYVKNVPQFNGMRWMFFVTLFAISFLAWFNRNYFVGKVEKLFLLIGLTAGTFLVLIVPLNKVGLDEETHFRNAYNIKLSRTVSTTGAIEELKVVTLSNWPYNLAQSREEREAIVEYYKQMGDYSKDSQYYGIVPTQISTVAAYNYIFMALGIKIGKLLQLSFTTVYTLGRLFNMWSYIFLIYFAIKKLPIGKYIMAILALMPTPLFQAAVYTYDAVVNGFVYLGLAYLIDELVHKDKILTVKNGVIMLGCLGFGMVPKAVYFPLMFLPFLIEKEKFVNKQQRRIFRLANVGCVLGLIVAIILPIMINPAIANDVRGGDVDATAQLTLILTQPIGYLRVWIANVASTFWSYMCGVGSLGTLGHLKESTCVPMIGLVMLLAIMTDNVEGSEKDLTLKQKLAFLVASVIAVACVWGTLYLAFNEVGVTTIRGVQGRYYIPVLFIFYLLLRRKEIKNTIRLSYYQCVIFGLALFIVYKTFFDCILQPYCF